MDGFGWFNNTGAFDVDVNVAVAPTPNTEECKLDADEDTNVDALTDGLLFIRHMFGIRGEGLVNNSVGTNCIKCTAIDIEDILDQCANSGVSDIDGNGEIDALTDGLLIIRYLFGIRGDSLIERSVANDCSRCTVLEIETYLQRLTSPPLVNPISENNIIKGDGPCVTIGAISPETKVKLDLEFFENNGSLNSTAKREQIIHSRDSQGTLLDQSTVYSKIDGAFSHSTDEKLHHKHEIQNGFVYENSLDASVDFVSEDQSTLTIEISSVFSPAYFERPDTRFCEGASWQIAEVVETKVQDGVVSTANRPVKSGEVTSVNTSISVPAGTYNTVLIKARELEEERLEWIDIETGNTIKIENYDEGTLENRHEVTSIN